MSEERNELWSKGSELRRLLPGHRGLVELSCGSVHPQCIQVELELDHKHLAPTVRVPKVEKVIQSQG